MVSGENLDVRNQDLETAHTYAVMALRRLDGTPLDNTFDLIGHPLTPLVAGYAPTAVNNWTLHAGASGFAEDGVYYYLLDTQSLEMFADRTVYMAFYEGGAPDASKADPAAADAFVESTGMTGWSNEHSGGEHDTETWENEDGSQVLIDSPNDGEYDVKREVDEDGNETVIVSPRTDS